MPALRRLATAIVLCALGAAAPPVLAQTTRFVATCGNNGNTGLTSLCGNPAGPKATVQGAIDASASGDIIEILAGTYPGAFNVNGKSLTIRAAAGAAVTLRAPVGQRILTSTTGNPTLRFERLTFNGTNIGPGAGGAALLSAGFNHFDQCTFSQNTANNGAAVYCDARVRFTRCTFTGNTGTFSSGAVQIRYENATGVFDDCVFSGNTSPQGGALVCESGSEMRVTRCTFDSNSAPGSPGGGGAVLYLLSSGGVIDNCVFRNNSAANFGGAIMTFNATLNIGSCTFYGNTAPQGPSFRALDAADRVVISSSIFGGGGPGVAQVAVAAAGNLILTDCITSGPAAPSVTEHNVLHNVDPLFVNASAADFRLTMASPAIDAGSLAAPGAAALDRAGTQRPLHGAGDPAALPDLGALEYSGPPAPPPPAFCAADFNGNGTIDATDIFIYLDAWFAGNGQMCP